MNKYIYVVDKKVQEVIPEYVEAFPDIPADQRYSKQFLDKCVVIDETIPVEPTWDYLSDVDLFKTPIIVTIDNQYNLCAIGQ